MPAMRFITSALPLLAVLVAAPAFAEDAKSPSVKTEAVKESTPGPLATGEQRLDNLFLRLKRERSTEQAKGIANAKPEIIRLATIAFTIATRPITRPASRKNGIFNKVNRTPGGIGTK